MNGHDQPLPPYFKKWAKGRRQLEILRRGWAQAGPWEQCVSNCEFLAQYPDHCYAVLKGEDNEDGAWVIHLHVYCDVEKEVQHILRVEHVSTFYETREDG